MCKDWICSIIISHVSKSWTTHFFGITYYFVTSKPGHKWQQSRKIWCACVTVTWSWLWLNGNVRQASKFPLPASTLFIHPHVKPHGNCSPAKVNSPVFQIACVYTLCQLYMPEHYSYSDGKCDITLYIINVFYVAKSVRCFPQWAAK